MKIISRILICSIIMCNIVHTSIVSDNDGSAFITKAEFDSLKNNFQLQIDKYNSQIDAKIDNAVASYLAGITTEKTFDMQTSFDIVGNASSVDSKIIKTVHFMGKDTNLQYATYRPITNTSISFIGTIGYQPIESYCMDTNNTVQFIGTYSKNNANSCVLVSDGGYVEEFLKNVKVTENRDIVCQGREGDLFWSGGIWKSISITATEPDIAQAERWTDTTGAPCVTLQAEGYGYRPPELYSGTAYTWTQTSQVWYVRDRLADAYVSSGGVNVVILNSNYSIRYDSESKINANYQWPFGVLDTNKFMVKPKVKNYLGQEVSKGHYMWQPSVNWEKSRPFAISTGVGLRALKTSMPSIGNITTDNVTINGVWPTLNCSLQYPSNYKYNKIKTIWDKDVSLTGGLLLVDGSKVDNGELEIEFKSNKDNTWLYFKNNTFLYKPTENDNTNLECKIYDETTKNYIDTFNPKLTTNGTIYKIKVPTEKGKNIYIATSVNNSDSGFDVELSQIGTAKLTSK